MVIVAAVGLAASYYAYRAIRIYRVATNIESQIRYLIQNGGTIGEAPASEAFSVDYLQAIFGENPDLLDKLKVIVQQGIADQPALNLGEVHVIDADGNPVK